jgi:hypothetical protein
MDIARSLTVRFRSPLKAQRAAWRAFRKLTSIWQPTYTSESLPSAPLSAFIFLSIFFRQAVTVVHSK